MKSAATSSLLEYTGSEIFASGISPTKLRITFMATLLLYKLAQSFERDQFRINRVSLYWDHSMLRQKQYDLVIENVPWRDFIEVRMLVTTLELRHTQTQQYGRRSTRLTNTE